MNEEIAELINNEAIRRREAYNCTRNCTWAEKYLQFVIDNLREKSLWPPSELRSESLKSIWRSLSDSDWALRSLESRNILGCEGESCAGDVFESDAPDHLPIWLDEARQKSRQMIRTLCYECVRQGRILEQGCEHGEAKETP